MPSQDPPRNEDLLVTARELGADLLVGDSYRRVGFHVWVTAGLVDVQGEATTHVARLDGVVDELFELQDRLVSELVAAVAPGADQDHLYRLRRSHRRGKDRTAPAGAETGTGTMPALQSPVDW